jgi:hypothetical protein
MKLALPAITMVLLLALGLACSGCQVAGYAANLAGGPATTAQYTPAHKPLVVIVKDQPDPTGMHVESEAISAEIERQITEYKIAPVISADRVMELRTSMPGEFSTMTPAKMGHAVGADQVLYVEIINSDRDSEATQDMLRGRISASIKMIDANTGVTLWPNDDSGGSIVNYQTPLKHLGDQTSALSVEQTLDAGFAERIVRMFRNYKEDE